MEIYLIRHGQTLWNRQRRMQGQLDSPLTLLGIRQAESVGHLMKRLIDSHVDYQMIASPLPRAWQTATIVAETMGFDADMISRDDGLAEMTWGDWDGMTADEISAQDPDRWQARIDDRWTVAPPGGGETQQDIVDRAKRFLDRRSNGEKLIVVAHGAFGRALRVAYLGLDGEAMLEMSEPHDAVFLLKDSNISQHGGDSA